MMRKRILFVLCFAHLCLLAGCAEIEVPEGKGKTAMYKGLPVAINVRGSRALPVEVKTDVNESIPVRLDIRGDSGLPIKLDVTEDTSVPVDIKLSQNVLLVLSIAGGIVLLIAMICFFAAIAAAHSAKAVSKSLDAMTKTRRQSGTETFNNLNG